MLQSLKIWGAGSNAARHRCPAAPSDPPEYVTIFCLITNLKLVSSPLSLAKYKDKNFSDSVELNSTSQTQLETHHCPEVGFTSFLFDGFIVAAIANPLQG